MQVVLKSHTFGFYRNSCPPMNGCYKMQTFEQLQRVRLVPRAAQAGKGVLFQPGYIAAADSELCGLCRDHTALSGGTAYYGIYDGRTSC